MKSNPTALLESLMIRTHDEEERLLSKEKKTPNAHTTDRSSHLKGYYNIVAKTHKWPPDNNNNN